MATMMNASAEDKKKQVSQWDFAELQDSLENYYGSPERLLLEAYKGLLYLVTNLDGESGVCIESIRDSMFPVEMILSDIHNALVSKETEELYLNHPEINRTKK